MNQELFWTCVSIYLTSTVKFIFGPIGGFIAGLGFWPTFLLTVSGMMTSVTILTFFGIWLRTRWFRYTYKHKSPKRFSPRSRQMVRIWRKYGMIGVAFLTPIFLSPVIGTMVAVSFGEQKNSILLNMAWSAVFWGAIFSFVFTFWGKMAMDLLRPILGIE